MSAFYWSGFSNRIEGIENVLKFLFIYRIWIQKVTYFLVFYVRFHDHVNSNNFIKTNIRSLLHVDFQGNSLPQLRPWAPRRRRDIFHRVGKPPLFRSAQPEVVLFCKMIQRSYCCDRRLRVAYHISKTMLVLHALQNVLATPLTEWLRWFMLMDRLCRPFVDV